MNEVSVLVVDDSALVRDLLRTLLDQQPGIRCVGVAASANEARSLIRRLNPDVLTLDVEMPGMNGLDFLRQLMRSRPMPVVMISSLTERGAETTLTALELGAVDFVAKPRFDIGSGIAGAAREIASKVRMAARARLAVRGAGPRPGVTSPAGPGAHRAAPTAPRVAAPAASRMPAPAPARPATARKAPRIGADTLIAIGASTGGTEAIRELLCNLPARCPPVVMVQHMPAAFTGSFARRLDQTCPMRVHEVAAGQVLEPGNAYLAPGHSHLRVRAQGGRLTAVLGDDAEISGHRPSVDALFESLWPIAGRVIGVILTGMGRDGARAMATLHDKGSFTYGQDETSCVVYGMPRAAAQAGAVDVVMSPAQIGAALSALVR